MIKISYPEEILVKIQSKYNLSVEKIQILQDSLMDTAIKTAVESGKFDPENLIIAAGIPTYITIISPIVAKQVVAEPKLLKSLVETILQDISSAERWDKIKEDIKKIENFSHKQSRERKRLAIDVSCRLINLMHFICSHPALISECESISSILPQYLKNSIPETIIVAAEDYFRKLYASLGKEITNITFLPKECGIQLGAIMKVDYIERFQSHQITYYIKTHQYGSTSEASSVRPVDPKELFVYKVLEYIGYGPKAHFFFNHLSLDGFFIATQDIAFTKTIGKTKTFTPFEDVASYYNTNFEAPELDDPRRNIIRFNIFSRVFRLSDTTINPGNFGFATVIQHGTYTKTKWKFIDFRVPDSPEFYLNKEIFRGFQQGNGIFNYSYSQFMSYALKNSNYEDKKMEMARLIMNELCEGKLCESRAVKKAPLIFALDKAYSEIIIYIKQNQESLGIKNLSLPIEDLDRYREAIIENFRILSEGIASVKQHSLESTDKLSCPRTSKKGLLRP